METSAAKTKLSLIVTVVLLIISLAVVVVSVSMTINEVHHFQQQHSLATHKDVRAIRSWMTLTYISRFYHVPEPYLVNALHLTDTHEVDELPIQILAQHNKRSVTDVTYALQIAITTYHRQHPPTPTPTSRHKSSMPPVSLSYTTHTRVVMSKHYFSHTKSLLLHRSVTVRSARI